MKRVNSDLIIHQDVTGAFFGCLGLRRIIEADIESIRQWRNSDRVIKTTISKQMISKEHQIAWFKSLNPIEDFIYVIEVNKFPIGVASLKKNGMEAETSAFIGEEEFDGKGYGVAAAFLLNYLAFNIIGVEKLIIRIVNDNQPALRMNRFLGYKRVLLGDEFQVFDLTKKQFDLNCSKLKSMIATLV